MRGRGGGGGRRGGCGSGLRNAVNRSTPRGSEESSTSSARLLFDVLAERQTRARRGLSCHTLYSGKNYSKSDSVQAHHDFFFCCLFSLSSAALMLKLWPLKRRTSSSIFTEGGRKKNKHPITYQASRRLQRARILPLQRRVVFFCPKTTMSRRRCYTATSQYATQGLIDFLNLKVRACSQEQICTVHGPSLTVKSSRLWRWYNIIKAIFSTGTARLPLIGPHEKHDAENWAACRRRSHFCVSGDDVSSLLSVCRCECA